MTRTKKHRTVQQSTPLKEPTPSDLSNIVHDTTPPDLSDIVHDTTPSALSESIDTEQDQSASQHHPHSEREAQQEASWAHLSQGRWNLDEAERVGFRCTLIAWYRQQRRDLPWRDTKDPYAIWLSEIMLQQTRVETVIPYYHRFLARYPTVFALAQAPLEEVLAMWSGLGYYRRAKLLHQAAKVIVEQHAGEFPPSHHAILSLPGIGRYTAGAIASIAFDEVAPLVDGNVFRILSRLFYLLDPIGSKELERASWQIAEQLVRGDLPGDLNQALMELGATCCLPRKPTCLICPVRSWCRGFASGKVAFLPTPKRTKESPLWQVAWAVVQKEQAILLVQRPEKGLFAEMWELPGLYQPGKTEISETTLLQALQDFGLFASSPQILGRYRHLLTHRKLSITVYSFSEVHALPTTLTTHFRWVDPNNLPNLALSSITRRVLKEIASSHANLQAEEQRFHK
ncbi:A/G-specific adenine glycosylase [Myxococcota bacterium]|nr:A/G-specific adenine glycosylase [Myxococcota bacterium]